MMRDMITFVRSSPKRLAWFTSLQTEEVNLRPFCPTRWTLRACSIKSVLDNLEELIVFMNEVAASDNGDAGYKAMGFATQLSKFRTFYVLKLLAKVFSHIDSVNTVIQSKKIDFHQCLSSVQMLRETVNSLRKTKSEFWADVVSSAEEHTVSPPSVPRLI